MTKHVTKKPITSLNCLMAFANVIVEASSISLDSDKLDATIKVGYQIDGGAVDKVEVPLSLLNDAYVGIVKLWPMIKEIKDEVVATHAAAAKEQKTAAAAAKKEARAKEVAERKAKREAEKKARLDDKAAAKAAREAARAAAVAKKAKEAAEAKAAREKALREKADLKAAAEKLKKDSDAKKLKDAANTHQQKTMDAGNKAVNIVKASAKKVAAK